MRLNMLYRLAVAPGLWETDGTEVTVGDCMSWCD